VEWKGEGSVSGEMMHMVAHGGTIGTEEKLMLRRKAS